MVHVIGPKDPRRKDAINTTYTSKPWSRQLSPFLLGPVKLYGNYISQNVENAWQFSRVYPEFADFIDEDPTPDYFEWAEMGWADVKAHRYPMGRDTKPLYSYWDGQKLSYIEARKKIYIPLYAVAVRSTDAYKKLRELYEEKEEIWLWDFDGYNHIEAGIPLWDVVNQKNRKMGHAFVLAMMLEQQKNA